MMINICCWVLLVAVQTGDGEDRLIAPAPLLEIYQSGLKHVLSDDNGGPANAFYFFNGVYYSLMRDYFVTYQRCHAGPHVCWASNNSPEYVFPSEAVETGVYWVNDQFRYEVVAARASECAGHPSVEYQINQANDVTVLRAYRYDLSCGLLEITNLPSSPSERNFTVAGDGLFLGDPSY